jgi:hypothetical protein
MDKIILENLISLGIIFAGVLVAVGTHELMEHIKYLKQEKEWLNQSFEWNGWRVNKDFYEVIDGKLVQKGNQP